MYKNLVEYLVKALVANDTKVNVTEKKENDRIIIVVNVASEDMGRVIGKDGRIIKSIREIIRAYSAKNGEKVSVDIEE